MCPTKERELIQLAQQGDEAAFTQLISDVSPKLRALLTSRFHLQPTDVDEVLQLATIKVWKKLGAFRSESAFSTWFYIVVKNKLLDFLNKKSQISKHEVSTRTNQDDTERPDYENLSLEQTFEDTALAIIERKELLAIYRKMIEDVLSELSPSHSQVIQLALDEGKTYKEVANELGIPIGTVMSRLFFARKEASQRIIQYAKRHSIQLAHLGGPDKTSIS